MSDMNINPERKLALEIYGDIIDFDYKESVLHKRMSRENRAAQFAPFAALTGYGEAVDETARLTSGKIEISEEKMNKINRLIGVLIGENSSDEKMPSTIIYYVPDRNKKGGAYVSHDALVKKYNSENNSLVMNDGIIIPVEDIFDIR